MSRRRGSVGGGSRIGRRALFGTASGAIGAAWLNRLQSGRLGDLVWVSATWAVTGASDRFRADRPVDDTVAVFGRLSCGAAAHLLCSRLVPGSDDALEACGTRGRLVCRGVLANDVQASLIINDGATETVRTFPRIDMLASELDQVSAAATAGADPRQAIAATGIDGVRENTPHRSTARGMHLRSHLFARYDSACGIRIS